MKQILIFFLAIISLTSCNNVYRKFEKVDEMKWYKNDKKKFAVDIEESGNYDMLFGFRYATLYPYRNIKVLITKTLPNGDSYTKDAEFRVVDENNNYIGSAGGDIWDLENIFAENEYLEKGKYQFIIEQDMGTDPVIVVMEIGLIVKKSVK